MSASALALSRALADRRGEARSLVAIGEFHVRLGQQERALDYYERALSLNRRLGDRVGEANTLYKIGQAYRISGRRREALGELNRALSLSRSIDDPRTEADALYLLARVKYEEGGLDESLAHIEDVLRIVESMRYKIGSDALRASYFASIHKYYELYVDLLMQLHRLRPRDGYAALALQASERARARGLLESLTGAHVDIRQGVEPALLERERSLQQSLSAKAAYQMRVLSSNRYPGGDDEGAKEVRRLMAEYQEVQARIREQSPRYASLTEPQPLNSKEIQAELRDGETLLLEYALGEERSYLWAVTADSLDSYELPGRATIEEAARTVYGLLTARPPGAGESFAAYQEQVAAADERYWKEASALSRMLLGPVSGQLGTKRLLIVSDGALQYIPFQALPAPAASENNGDHAPLILDHEIVSLPSASVLEMLRRKGADRRPAAKDVAVLADPVFEADDPRVTSPETARPAPAVESYPHVPRLIGAHWEAEAILSLSPAGKSQAILGFAASREAVMNSELSDYKIIHFATHGLINNTEPELSGMVLSLFDKQGRPQNGFLTLSDINNLKLSADLVVLSACQTGFGKDLKGEGLIGLTRGFMYAGADNVVASLWKVDDMATADLMARFYRGMLADGLTPAAALREAQIEMWRHKRWRAPYFWAAFTIQGGGHLDGPVQPRGTKFASYSYVAMLPIGISLIWVVRLRRRSRMRKFGV